MAKTAPGSMTRPTSAPGREAGVGVAGNHPIKTSFYGPALRRRRASRVGALIDTSLAGDVALE